MSIPVVFNWPAPDTQAVSLTQALTVARNLTINGTLVNVGSDLPKFASFTGIYRKVTLTSVDDYSAVNFTITGQYRGQTISEVLAGPNANTVSSVNFYESISSIAASGGVALGTISAGTASTGFTRWFNSNYQSSVVNLAIQAVITGTINYSFQTTLDDVQLNATPTTFTPITTLTAATANQLGSYTVPTRYSRIAINSSTNGTLVATFLQQGIT